MFQHQTSPVTGQRTPNCIADYTDFVISHNATDVGIYGDETTTIVLGQMQLFLILNGDHRAALQAAADCDGLQGCIDYFIDNVNLANSHSEHIRAFSNRDMLGQDNIQRIEAAVSRLNSH